MGFQLLQVHGNQNEILTIITIILSNYYKSNKQQLKKFECSSSQDKRFRLCDVTTINRAESVELLHGQTSHVSSPNTKDL